MPNIVEVSEGHLRVRDGFETIVDAPLGDAREVFAMVRGWKDDELLRPACTGASDVVVADGNAATSMVLTVGAALTRDCETPTRYGLESEAVAMSGVHFCACRAVLPLTQCSTSSLTIAPTGIETKRHAQWVGDETCSPGARPMLPAPIGGVRPELPPEPPPEVRRHESLEAALASLEQPHAGLPECQDAWVTVPDSNWGEAHGVLSAFHRARPSRISVMVWTPPYE